MKLIPCHIFNSLTKPPLEALDDMINKEEGELEEDDDDEEGQNKKNKTILTSTKSLVGWA